MKYSQWEKWDCEHGVVIGKSRWGWDETKGETIEDSAPDIIIDLHKCPKCKLKCDCYECMEGGI